MFQINVWGSPESFKVSKDLSDETPIYTVISQFDGSKFCLFKGEDGWLLINHVPKEYDARFIEAVGVAIERDEPEDFDPDYDEEAILDDMGLLDEESEEGFDWTLED